MSNAPNQDLRFIVIGAGMAGILATIKLREAGYSDITIYEKNPKLGGTWYENTYPGLSCDVPSHLYSYDFAPNPEWSRQFSPGPEIREYFEDVAKRFGVFELIRFDTEATHCAFADGRWQLELADGSRDQADFIIAATGVLHHPNLPDFQGLDSFAGAAFHSARWDHDVATEGKKVGVVGTGSSAVQIVTALAGEVGELVLFQRTPQWIMPVPNRDYSTEEKENFRKHPGEMRKIRDEVSKAFIEGFANALVDADAPTIQAIQTACEANLEENVREPELRERLRPNYRAACKRLVMCAGFYDAVQHPNTRLVTDPIERIEPEGVRTADGSLHELDVLVMATGFKVEQFVRPMTVIGRNGVALDDIWHDGPSAYLAVTVPEVPNFYMLNGPNGPVGNFSLIDVADLEVGYILQLIEEVGAGRARELCVSREAMDRFNRERKQAAKTTIWATGCNSWYLDASGLPTAWPWTYDRFTEEMAQPKLDDYDVR